MDDALQGGNDETPTAISRLTDELDTARRSGNCYLCQQILAEAVFTFETDSQALDRTLFDVFGTVVQCASCQCHSLVQLYLQLVTDHCSGREVMTLLMATLDCTAEYACWSCLQQEIEVWYNQSCRAVQVRVAS